MGERRDLVLPSCPSSVKIFEKFRVRCVGFRVQGLFGGGLGPRVSCMFSVAVTPSSPGCPVEAAAARGVLRSLVPGLIVAAFDIPQEVVGL